MMNTLMKTPARFPKRARPAYVTDNEKWKAVLAGDRNADGQFYYAVRTTGVYCLPSCTARTALRENVIFFATPEDAERGGYRACKRCWPKGPKLADEHGVVVARACRVVESAEKQPTLEELARIAGMSPFHFHRVFKAITGLTPKEYAVAQRARRVREALPRRGTVTEAIYEAGFGSNGRFYATASETLGMTPAMFRRGGAGATIRFAVGECSLGKVLVAASEKGVCAISLGDDSAALVQDLRRRFSKANLVDGDAGFEHLVAKVVRVVEEPRIGLDLPLDVRGTAFQQRVWRALREIPAGSTASYTEIARRIGAPKAVRAVAGACAANALAVAIPCHRVVRNDGSLSGYRWGAERKRRLLLKEENGVGKDR